MNTFRYLAYCLRYGHMYGELYKTKDGTHVKNCLMCGWQKEYI